MTLRDVLCSSCSDVALSVDESRSAEEVERNTGETYCLSCSAKGDVRVRDDGQACEIVFEPSEADEPVPFVPATPEPVNTLVGDIIWLASAEFGRQRSAGFYMRDTSVSLPQGCVSVKVWQPRLVIDLFEELKKSLEQAAQK
jgi:hypothetical protein